MPPRLAALGLWLAAHLDVLVPLLLSLAMAGWDLKSKRIPNELTLGGALAGLGFQLGFHGLPGLWDGLAGWGLGFGLLMVPYCLGGMGAGDVKGGAALGAWLGLSNAFRFYIYMGLAGGAIVLGVWLWQGRLWAGLRQWWHFLFNWVLCRPCGSKPPPPTSAKSTYIPYGTAMALGMAILCWRRG